MHVEFDGDVTRTVVCLGYEYVEVAADGGAPSGPLIVRVDHCTVIVPPVKVGDVVTPENIGQLPHGSVVATDGGIDAVTLVVNAFEGTTERRWFYGGRWQPGTFDHEVTDRGYRVLRIGGGE